MKPKTLRTILQLELGFILFIIITICSCCGQKTVEYIPKEIDGDFIYYEMESIPKVEHIEGRTTDTYCCINVDPIMQLPELPTGCEVTSLAMALNYHGYVVDKLDLWDDYLLYKTEDYPVGFNGSCMWPPAIVDMINNFMMDNEDERIGIDKSGSYLYELLDYINRGIPSIVWVNDSYSSFIEYDGNEFYYEGHLYQSYWGEHCIILKGYDLDKGVVIVNDPLEGEKELDIYLFEGVYNACGKYAVIIDLP